MSLLPSDLPSFLWGAVVGVAAAFGTGFFKKAGEGYFAFLSNKFYPKPVEPIQVDGKFEATIYDPGKCAWVGELQLYDSESRDFFYYPHPSNNARCFRLSPNGSLLLKEFLMVQPNTKKKSV